MARRQLDTGFWDDEDVAALSLPARLLLVCMITDTSLTDDYGALSSSPAILKKHAFGYDAASMTDVTGWRDEILRTCRNVVPYHVKGKWYIALLNFEDHQSTKYKRKDFVHPRPPGGFGKLVPSCLQIDDNLSESLDNLVPTLPLSSGEMSSDQESPDQESPGEPNYGDDDATASPESDPEAMAVALRYVEEMFGLNAMNGEKAQDLASEYGVEALTHALTESHDHGANNWAYVRAILKNEGKPRAGPSTPLDVSNLEVRVPLLDGDV